MMRNRPSRVEQIDQISETGELSLEGGVSVVLMGIIHLPRYAFHQIMRPTIAGAKQLCQ